MSQRGSTQAPVTYRLPDAEGLLRENRRPKKVRLMTATTSRARARARGETGALGHVETRRLSSALDRTGEEDRGTARQDYCGCSTAQASKEYINKEIKIQELKRETVLPW